MAKKLCLLFCFLLAVATTYGQDIITRSDGVVIKAAVLEIKPNLITFKLFQQPDTLVYQISPEDVHSVQMVDGTVKRFMPAAALKAATSFNYDTDLGRNILWYYPFDLIFSNFTLAYERIAPAGKVGFKIPVSVGLGTPDLYGYDEFRRNNRFGAGLEINLYPFGQGRIQYFYGPAFSMRSYASNYTTLTNPMDPNARPETREENAQMYTAALKNGVYYQFSKSFLISGDIGLGVRFFSKQTSNPYSYEYERRTRGYLPINLHLGFRF